MTGVQQLSKTYAKGLEFYDQGLLVDAVAAFEAVIKESEPGSPEAKLARFYVGEAHARLAEDNLHRGSKQRAEQHLRDAIECNPKYPDLHYQLAQVLVGEDAIHEAMVELEVALEINPNYAKALLMLGVLAYEIGEYDAGADHVMRAADMEPRYQTSVYEEAVAAHKNGTHRKALSCFKELVTTNVDDISFHVNTGKRLYRSGEYPEAVEAFEQALSIQSNYPDVRNWLGLALMGCGEYEHALEHFEKALDINPNYVGATINAGVAYGLMGMRSEAAELYRKALEIDPDNLEARERLESL